MSDKSNHGSKQITIAVPRPSILKSLRFDVFKRDSFTCQYCGRRAPDVALYCVHVNPSAESGGQTLATFTTACGDCKVGKVLDEDNDHSVLMRRLNRLTVLQEREEQAEMLAEWERERSNLDEVPVTRLDKQWIELTGYRLAEAGRAKVRNLVKKYGAELVGEAMRTAAAEYLERGKSGAATEASMARCFDSIGAIASVEHAERLEPGARRMFFIRDALRKRLSHCPHGHALNLIRSAARSGASLDLISKIGEEAPTWSHFRNAMEHLISEAEVKNEPQTQTRNAICQTLSHFTGQVPEEVLAELISCAREAGMSEAYLLEAGAEFDWLAFKEFVECAIRWRRRILAPLRSALGGYLPDDEELSCIHDAVIWGHSEESILDVARVFKSWPKVKEFLRESVSPLEYIEIGKFLADRKTHSLAGR